MNDKNLQETPYKEAIEQIQEAFCGEKCEKGYWCEEDCSVQFIIDIIKREKDSLQCKNRTLWAPRIVGTGEVDKLGELYEQCLITGERLKKGDCLKCKRERCDE